MRRFCPLLLTIVAAQSLGACAVAVKHEYEQLSADIRVKSPQIALGVHDQQPYVLTRGGFNNPFDASTAPGKPMADDLAEAIADSLTHNGAQVTAVRLDPKMSKTEAVRQAFAKR